MEDVWLHVFSRLPANQLLKFEVVSPAWRALIAETIRKRATLDFEKHFPGSIERTETMRLVIEKHGPALTDVVIRVKPKTLRFLQYVSEHHLTRKVVRNLRTTASRLRRLRIERMNLTIGAVEELAELPSSLQELALVNCSLSCDSPELCQIAQNSFKTLFQRCQQLKRLEIAWRGLCFEYFELTDDVLSALPDSIEDLNISAGSSLKITNLEFLQGKRLQSLILQRSFVSAADLRYLLPSADSFRSLDLTSSINILDVSLISKLHNLRELWLGGMREGVDDEGLLVILKGCRLLEWLCIENLTQIGQNSLLKLGLLKNLKRLEAAGLQGFTESCCQALLENCGRLEFLDLKYCRSVTNAGILALFQLPSLSHLEIVGIPSFSRQLLFNSQRPATVIADNFSHIGGGFPIFPMPLIPSA